MLPGSTIVIKKDRRMVLINFLINKLNNNDFELQNSQDQEGEKHHKIPVKWQPKLLTLLIQISI